MNHPNEKESTSFDRITPIDLSFSPVVEDAPYRWLRSLGLNPRQGQGLVTHDNAQLLALSGPRNPYPGKLGVVVPGALADLILVDGNPLEDFNLIADPQKRFLVIMKDGRLYKNSIVPQTPS